MNMFRRAWEMVRAGLIAIGTVLGVINTFLLLTIVYVFIIGPIALIFRIGRHDPLARTGHEADSFWRVKEEAAQNETESERQF
jgi:hypothetical protein